MDPEDEESREAPKTQETRGLDLELLRRERELLETNEPARKSPEAVGTDPPGHRCKSEMAQNIVKLFADPRILRRDRVDFKEKKDELLEKIARLDPWESLEGFSSFLKSSRYVFRDDSKVPIIVLPSKEEVEDEKERRKRLHLVRVRKDPESIRIVREALQRIKSRKKRAKMGLVEPMHAVSKVHKKNIVQDEDLDIFADFSPKGEIEKPVVKHISGPLFPELHPPSRDLSLEVMSIKEVIARKTTSNVASFCIGRNEEEDMFGGSTEFGKKLDISKFQNADEQSTKKHKSSTDKQLFHLVMKKVDQLK